MRGYADIMDQYLNDIDELDEVSVAGAGSAAVLADLESDVAAVLRAAGPARVKRPCRRRRTAWLANCNRKRAAQR